jgi:probable phosphoglycerate mutase
MTTIVLTRHGETTWNRDGRVQGWAPSALTDRGREQAEALGAHLAATYGADGVDRLLSSDLRRARETTERVARALSAEPAFEPEWRERNFGTLQGLTQTELFGGYPQFAVSAVGYAAVTERPEGGETIVEARQRVLSRWTRLLRDADPDEMIVVVTHGGPLHHLVGEINRFDVVRALTEQEQSNCALNEVRYDPDTGATELRLENERAFLEGPIRP